MNLELMNLVKDQPAELTDEQVFAALSNKDIEIVDHTLYSFRELVKRFGVEQARQVLGVLQAAAAQDPILALTHAALAAQGIDFADPESQGMIDQLVLLKAFTEQQGAALKEIGVQMVSTLDQAGQSDATLLDITAARRDERYRTQVKERLRSLWNTCIVLAETGDLTLDVFQPLADAVSEGLEEMGV